MINLNSWNLLERKSRSIALAFCRFSSSATTTVSFFAKRKVVSFWKLWSSQSFLFVSPIRLACFHAKSTTVMELNSLEKFLRVMVIDLFIFFQIHEANTSWHVFFVKFYIIKSIINRCWQTKFSFSPFCKYGIPWLVRWVISMSRSVMGKLVYFLVISNSK